MRTFVALMALMSLVPITASALPSASQMKTKLNQNVVPSDGNLFRIGDQLTNKRTNVMKVSFDTSVLGKTINGVLVPNNYSLKDVDGTNATIPSGALIKEAWIDIRGTFQSNSAAPSFCLQLQSSCDLKAGQTTQAFQTNGTTAFRQIVPKDGTTVFRLTADQVVTAVLSGGSLTGGTMNVFIEYYLP